MIQIGRIAISVVKDASGRTVVRVAIEEDGNARASTILSPSDASIVGHALLAYARMGEGAWKD